MSNESKWVCMNRAAAIKEREHFIFRRETEDGPQYAIADHSLMNKDDPATGDDGLMLISGTWRGGEPRVGRLQSHNNGIMLGVPVLAVGHDSSVWVTGSAIYEALAALTALKIRAEVSQELIQRALDINAAIAAVNANNDEVAR